jgi:hypothetical protein
LTTISSGDALGRTVRLLGPPTGSTPRGRGRSLPPGPATKAGLHPFRQRNYSPSTSRLPTPSSPHYGHGARIAASILPTAHPLTLIHRSAWKKNSAKFGFTILHRYPSERRQDGFLSYSRCLSELAVRGSLVLLPERLHVGLLRLAQGSEEPQQTGVWLISGLGQLHDLWRRHNMWSKAAQASDVRFFS